MSLDLKPAPAAAMPAVPEKRQLKAQDTGKLTTQDLNPPVKEDTKSQEPLNSFRSEEYFFEIPPQKQQPPAPVSAQQQLQNMLLQEAVIQPQRRQPEEGLGRKEMLARRIDQSQSLNGSTELLLIAQDDLRQHPQTSRTANGKNGFSQSLQTRYRKEASKEQQEMDALIEKYEKVQRDYEETKRGDGLSQKMKTTPILFDQFEAE